MVKLEPVSPSFQSEHLQVMDISVPRGGKLQFLQKTASSGV